MIVRRLLFIMAMFTSVCVMAKEEPKLHIVPRPQIIEFQKGTFNVCGTPINCDDRFDETVRKLVSRFAGTLSLVSPKVSSYANPTGLAAAAELGHTKGMAFIKDNSMASGAYHISVTPKFTVIKASDFYGVLYSIQTLKQMLPLSVYGKKPGAGDKWRIPCVEIDDAPRFAYRGMHLDCSRHFFSVQEVKKYLDIMAIYKLNRLHWHITDDQGWRVEIKAYPELTQTGAFRHGTMIGRDFNSDDHKRYGGYYTQEQIREIVAYAENLGITVIPEIDLPGHMLAALASYPELGCTGGPYEVWHLWGVSPQVLCPGKEATFRFLETVLGEIAELFPSEYIHIGGDECPKEEWEKCPDCQALIAKLGLNGDEEFTAEQYLQNYVTSRMQDYLSTLGKKIIGWDEILEGELAPGATVMSWRGTSGGIKAAGMGFDVIMTPTDYCYFDYCQADDRSKEPLCIGGYVPVEKIYSFEPLEGIEPAAHKHILGVQANLWTEYIDSDSQLEYMLLPRLLALSEVQWCRPEVRDFERFKEDVVTREFPLLDFLGYNYSKVMIGIYGLDKQ